MTYTTTLWATEKIEYIFPRGVNSEIEGVKYTCLNIGEYKTIAHVFVSNKSKSHEIELLLKKISALENINNGLKLQLSIGNSKVEFLNNKLKSNKESRFKLYLPWVLVVIESIALSTVSVYSVVK